MHVMIATDGSGNDESAAEAAHRLAGPAGKITVLTVVEVPREMLAEMRAAASGDTNIPSESVEYSSAQKAGTSLSQAPLSWIGDDAVISRYVAQKVADRTARLSSALEARGAKFEAVGVEGETVSRTVLAEIVSRSVDAVCIGTHGLGRFEGLLGSSSTKIARLAPCSVVLIR